MSTLSERLEEVMKENPEFTQASIARACGIKQPSVNDWINGRTKRMRGEVLLKAARYLNVDENWLATGKGTKQRKIETDTDLIRMLGVDTKDLGWDVIKHIQLFVKASDSQKEDVTNYLKESFNSRSKETGAGPEGK